jgi:hypothetical protein
MGTRAPETDAAVPCGDATVPLCATVRACGLSVGEREKEVPETGEGSLEEMYEARRLCPCDAKWNWEYLGVST